MEGSIIALILLLIMTLLNYKWQLDKNKEMKEKIKTLTEEMENLTTENLLLKMANRRYKFSSFNVDMNKPIEIPKGTIDAVKLAMKVSHPDNGGKQEDFIRYREVYVKLTKKRG